MWCATGVSQSRQSYFLSKGQDVLMLPTKVPGQVKRVVPFTVNTVVPGARRTKDRTVEFGVSLYRKILRRA